MDIRRVVGVMCAQAGFRTDRLTAGWILGGAVSVVVFLLVRAFDDAFATVLYFAATSAFYYLGNAWYLASQSAGARGQAGVAAARAWNLYQHVVGLMFFNQVLGFSAVAGLSFAGSTVPVSPVLATVLGGLLFAAGIVAKTWATLVVGVDCFYYKDLFFRRRFWTLSTGGPYALFANPMYGVGNLHLYGLALLGRSLPGLAAAAFCHVAIYTFHHALERPFVRDLEST